MNTEKTRKTIPFAATRDEINTLVEQAVEIVCEECGKIMLPGFDGYDIEGDPVIYYRCHDYPHFNVKWPFNRPWTNTHKFLVWEAWAKWKRPPGKSERPPSGVQMNMF